MVAMGLFGKIQLFAKLIKLPQKIIGMDIPKE
jgi:hypothetical protein